MLKRREHLARHIRRFHSGADKLERCHLCDFTAYTRRPLLMHIEVHHQDNMYPCATCGLSFRARPYLQNHERNVHGDKRYACQHCDFQFKTKYYLTRHLRSVHSDRYAGLGGGPPHCNLSV